MWNVLTAWSKALVTVVLTAACKHTASLSIDAEEIEWVLVTQYNYFVKLVCLCQYRVFQKKSSPLKTFWNIFTSVNSFCVKFCKFVGSSCPHISANFLYIYLNISSNGVNFSTSTHRCHLVKFWVGLFTQKMKMQLFGNDVIFSSTHVSVSDNCKQSITVWLFTINVLLTLF